MPKLSADLRRNRGHTRGWLSLGLTLLLIFTAADATARTLRLFMLTGQSNCLGLPPTTNAEAIMVLPKIGTQPAEQLTNVPFYYDNTADGTPAGDAALGDSGGWTNLCLQKGGYYAYSADHCDRKSASRGCSGTPAIAISAS